MRDSRGPSVGPALIVVVIAAVVVFGGLGLSFAFGGTAPAAGPSGGGVGSVTDGLAAVPAARAIALISNGGQPPADVAGSLVVPAGAKVSGHRDQAAGLGPFDRSVTLSVAASPSDVIAFYRAQLPRHGWGLLPGGAAALAGHATELFYKRAGSDGYYWEVAVTVTPVNPSISPALAGGDQTAPSTRLVLDLVQAGDSA